MKAHIMMNWKHRWQSKHRSVLSYVMYCISFSCQRKYYKRLENYIFWSAEEAGFENCDTAPPKIPNGPWHLPPSPLPSPHTPQGCDSVIWHCLFLFSAESIGVPRHGWWDSCTVWRIQSRNVCQGGGQFSPNSLLYMTFSFSLENLVLHQDNNIIQ